MKSYSHIARAVLTRPWAIDRKSPEWAAIKDVLEHRVAGDPFTEEEIQNRLQAAVRPRSAVIGGSDEERRIAILPIYGVLMPRSNILIEMSGGASVAQLSAAFADAVNDESVAAIVLDVDSPGGSVGGIPEFGAQIMAARGSKPITAVADTDAFSAAYWLATQADDLSISPSGRVGSVGVFSEHENWAKFWEETGMEHTYVHYGENKVGGNEFEPLSDHEREQMQSMVDYYGRLFDQAVAKGRGVTTTAVRESFGQGDIFPAADAVKLKMADQIETLGEAIDRLSQPQNGRRRGSSALAYVDVEHADPTAADEAVVEAVENEEQDLQAELDAIKDRIALRPYQRRRQAGTS